MNYAALTVLGVLILAAIAAGLWIRGSNWKKQAVKARVDRSIAEEELARKKDLDRNQKLSDAEAWKKFKENVGENLD